jgi:probable HAF family extracellular repeat protein
MKIRDLRVAIPALFAVFAAMPVAGETYTITNLGLGGTNCCIIVGAVNAKGQVAGTSPTPGIFSFDHAFFATQADGNFDIGTLGGDASWTTDMNASGQVVGYSLTAEGRRHAFSWTRDGGIVDLGTLGGTSSNASAVNDAGVVVGNAWIAGDAYVRAFAWTKAGGMVELPSLGGNSGALSINAQGQIAGAAVDLFGVAHAVVWNPGGGIKILGPLAGATREGTHLINDAGYAAGISMWLNPDNTLKYQHAFFYSDATGMIDMGTLGGGSSTPTAINSQGQVIGYSTTIAQDSGTMHGFTWTQADGLIDLTLGGNASFALDVNASGQVVGSARTAAGRGRAFSWTRSGGIVDLGTLGGSWSSAASINKDGAFVGASALAGDATSHGFLYESGTMKDLNSLVPNKPIDLEVTAATRLTDSGFIIANTSTGMALLSPASSVTAPPVLGQITANDPVAAGATLALSASFTDAANDTHTATWTYGDGTPSQAGTVTESGGSGTASGSHTFSAAGVYPVTVTVKDNTGLTSQVSRSVVVYDAAYGFVTGSGWFQSPEGAYKPDPVAAGRAMFTFVSKYQRGANAPTGTTEFRFQTANLQFESDTYEWLVVAGARAQFKGTGWLNDVDGFKFLVTAIDGQIAGGGATDRFRIKIWRYDANLKQDVMVYDNQLSSTAEGTLTEGTAIGGGVITIHASKN